MPVSFKKTAIPEVLICELEIFSDQRGFFVETFHREKYATGGMSKPFVQDNYSHSIQTTLRGLHYQLHQPQAKLVSAIRGFIFDVAVDIRRGSPTFGKWVGTILSEENGRQLYIPEGFAHGFCVLSDSADVLYKCTNFYAPDDEYGILWSDPAIDIEWPIKNPLISTKDQQNKALVDMPPEKLPE